VRAGDVVFYRRRISALPERRILLDLESLRIPQEVSQLVVEIVA
jgi:hypothetical protein